MVSVQLLHDVPGLFLATVELKPLAGLLLLSIYMTVVDFFQLYIKKRISVAWKFVMLGMFGTFYLDIYFLIPSKFTTLLTGVKSFCIFAVLFAFPGLPRFGKLNLVFSPFYYAHIHP